MEETISPFCNKRNVDAKLHITEVGFKLNSYDLGTMRVDEHSLLDVKCCSTCYYIDKKIKKYSMFLKWISVSIFIISIPIMPYGYKLDWEKYIDIDTLAAVSFAISIILFILSYTLSKFRGWLLKHLN